MLQILSLIRNNIHNKILIRFFVGIAIPVISLMALLYLLDPDPKVVGDFIKRSVMLEGIIVICGMLGSFSVIAVWVFMLYHWRASQFNSDFCKNLWLLLLLFVNILAAIIYYVVVFELHMTLKSGQTYKVESG